VSGSGDRRPSPLARLLGRSTERRALRWNLVELCRRTAHEGWEHLQAAEAAGRGVALVVAAAGPWVIAARALAAWAGPLHLAPPAGAAERRLARRLCSAGRDRPRLAPDDDAAGRALAAGEKVLYVVAGQTASGLAPPAIPAGVPILPLAVEHSSRGRYRLVVGKPGS